MSEGGCLCGNVRIKAHAESPGGKAVCHCEDCRKISGSVFSTNLIVPVPEVIKGKPKIYSKTADSGKEIVSYFCDNCGSTLFRTGESFGDQAVLKVGVMDDQSILEASKPQVELFAGKKLGWVPFIDGAGRKKTMPGSDDL